MAGTPSCPPLLAHRLCWARLSCALAQNNMLTALEDNSPGWDVAGSRQQSGMLLLVFARKRLASQLGASAAAAVACGIMGVGGNKGAVGVRVSLFRRNLVFVNCHLSAHQNAVAKRNANYEAVLDGMSFFPAASANDYWRRSSRQSAAPAAPLTVRGGVRGDDDDDEDGPEEADQAPAQQVEWRTPLPMGLGDSELLVWMGDTNYRLDTSAEAAVAAISRGPEGLRELRRVDQCRKERAAGRAFRGMREGVLRFAPTYKFDKGASQRLAYDSSEKRRVPAWCDRILWADASGGMDPGADSGDETAAEGGVDGTLPCVAAALERYESVPEVCDSDHKPVRALLRVVLPVVDARKYRRAYCTLVDMSTTPAQSQQHESRGACDNLISF